MASAAIAAMLNFLMRTSFASMRKDERARSDNQLTVWQECNLLPTCNLPADANQTLFSDHPEQPRQPQRNLRDVGNQTEEDQHRAQPGQHRQRNLADPHLGDAGSDI